MDEKGAPSVRGKGGKRGAVKMRFIEQERRRSSSFSRRKDSLLKRARELGALSRSSTAMMIVYNGRLYATHHGTAFQFLTPATTKLKNAKKKCDVAVELKNAVEQLLKDDENHDREKGQNVNEASDYEVEEGAEDEDQSSHEEARIKKSANARRSRFVSLVPRVNIRTIWS